MSWHKAGPAPGRGSPGPNNYRRRRSTATQAGRQETVSDLLAAAIDYHRLGWGCLFVRGKQAAGPWARFRKRRPSIQELHALAASQGLTGVAVLCGPVSGGLCVRDFDAEDAYLDWAARHAYLARSLPTVRTRRGHHVYCVAKDARFHRIVTIDVDGHHLGEWRGAGYILAPPSLHPEGGIYRWIIEPGNDVPDIDPIQAQLLPEQPDTTESTERTENTSSMLSVAWTRETRAAVEQAVQRTQPSGFGQRRRCLFRLCRELRAIPEVAGATPRQLRSVVEQWHRLAKPRIRTKDFPTSWADFCDGWALVRYPAGQGPAEQALEAARTAEDPPEIDALGYSAARSVALLIKWCRTLQGLAGAHPFYLSYQAAARGLDVDPGTAGRWLRMLVHDGVLEVVEPHTRSRATRYRYKGLKTSLD